MELQFPSATQTEACVATLQDAILTLGGHPVLNRATLSLCRGETYVLLGPNGAGKTSLIRALCGCLPLDSGRIGIGAALEDPRRTNEVLRLIGYVPQTIAIFPRLTVRENLEVFSRFVAADPHPVIIDHLLEITRLSSTAETVVATLSGGLQRRVNIAVALVTVPQLLLLDEPTVGVDLEARSAIHQVLGDLRERGVAILLTTHDFEQAERLADKIGFMDAGRIVLEGSPSDVLSHAFGAKQQIDVVLTNDIDTRMDALLRALGLEPVDGRLLWRGLASDAPDASRVINLLRSSSVPLREIRIRQPGLDTLFHQVTGRPAT
jgi:ABC-2 type transport system ATP-binding protein